MAAVRPAGRGAGSDHLSGRRAWRRHGRAIDVVCQGVGATIAGRTVDLSRGGMLVEAHDPSFPPVGEGEFVPMGVLVSVGFAGPMEARFAGAEDTPVQAHVVRVTTNPQDPKFLRLGCRFTAPLSPETCRRLGIDPAEAPDPALALPSADDHAAVAFPPAPASAASPPVLERLDTGGRVVERPSLEGRVRAALEGRAGALGGWSEQRMFGGLFFLVGGHLAVGIVRGRLIVRAARGAVPELLRRPHVEPAAWSGRPQPSFVALAPEAYGDPAQFDRWLGGVLDVVASLPARPRRPA